MKESSFEEAHVWKGFHNDANTALKTRNWKYE